MNKENTEAVLGHIMNAAFMAALPDSKKQSLWDEAVKVNPDYPIIPYFQQITDEGIPGIRGIFEKLRTDA
jgi:hypothetical protein